jgi:hypothetical protein
VLRFPLLLSVKIGAIISGKIRGILRITRNLWLQRMIGTGNFLAHVPLPGKACRILRKKYSSSWKPQAIQRWRREDRPRIKKRAT